MNSGIKMILRKRDREYNKKGKLDRWRTLRSKARHLAEKAKDNLKKDFVEDLRNTDPKMWMKNMKRLGRAHYEKETVNWKFENEISDDQTLTDDLCSYFSGISNHFHPLDRSKLHPSIVVPPNAAFVSEVNCHLIDHEVYKVIKNQKKTFSVPADIHPKIVAEFLIFLVRPLFII